MDHKTAIYARIAAALAELGWELFDAPRCSGLAQLKFETAVGDKYAVAREFWPSDTEFVTLNGDYLSEGHNVLNAVFIPLSHDATDEQLKEIVLKYDTNVRKMVDDSYARRLFLQGMKP